MHLLAYFFPQDEKDHHRRGRALLHGRTIISDLELAREKGSILGEKTTYCLGDPTEIQWLDSDQRTIARQLELARSYGLYGFIVDTFIGCQNSQPVEELGATLDCISKLAFIEGVHFCLMSCLKLPRAILPVSKTIEETGRQLDLSFNTAKLIVDRVAQVWSNQNYIHIGGKPYLSLYGLLKGQDCHLMHQFINSLRDYAYVTYRTELFLVGVGQIREDFEKLADAGFDELTQYAGLPNFNSAKTKPIQDYRSQLELQIEMWTTLSSLGLTNFVPSVAVGWDASIRGETVDSLSEVIGMYPYTPIVVNKSLKLFSVYLNQVYAYLTHQDGQDSKYLPIFAWNETGEGAALLPEVKDGVVDFSYLDVVLSFSKFLSNQGD